MLQEMRLSATIKKPQIQAGRGNFTIDVTTFIGLQENGASTVFV